MPRTLARPVLTADLDGIKPGGITFVHDSALHGDEKLSKGKKVMIEDGSGARVEAEVVDHDDRGFWYLRLTH